MYANSFIIFSLRLYDGKICTYYFSIICSFYGFVYDVWSRKSSFLIL
ncbi:hypothetical protein HCMG_01119 [Helicobacter canadensis MIT 98-5491]|nr:hypothetical protein HCMG_01119 [Helicobacter canadensis MIT 98-5491]